MSATSSATFALSSDEELAERQESVEPASSTEFDWATLIANKNSEIARLEAAYTTNLEKSGVRVVKARAQFEDAHCLRLSSGEIERLRGDGRRLA